jgi:hypothetical protein
MNGASNVADRFAVTLEADRPLRREAAENASMIPLPRWGYVSWRCGAALSRGGELHNLLSPCVRRALANSQLSMNAKTFGSWRAFL